MPLPINRRRFLSTLIAATLTPAAAMVLAGCPNSTSSSGNGGNGTAGGTEGAGTSPSPAPSGGASGSPAPAASGGGGTLAKIKAGLVTDVGGVHDGSFNQLAWEGLQRAAKDLGFEPKYTESKQNADYATNLTRFAEGGYDLVFAVGFLMQDALKDVAPRFPKVKFAIIDGDAPDAPNCVAYKFREEEGSFLVGALAGAMTKSGTVGFVGGMEMPLIKKFEAGYKAGVETTNPKAKVEVGYAGKFDDPQQGQELAISQMGSGADIIFHAAGSTGKGVIKAVQAKGAGFYAIGVDKDQDGEAPGRVLTSMVKHVDVAVVDVCKAVAGGTFQPGTTILGLKEDGVGISPMQYTKKDVPAPVLAKIDDLKKQIISGTIKPPATLDELKLFTPPK